MATIEQSFPIECAKCGHKGMRVRMSREPGAGAELLMVCEGCGAETWDDLSEALSRALSKKAAEPPPH